MTEAKKRFLKTAFIPLLKALDPDAQPRWGKMNGQQMAEHVTDFFNVSNGKLSLPLMIPEEHLPQYKAFLLSDKEFRENTKAPGELIGEEPAPVRLENMETAIAKLRHSVDRFFDYFAADPLQTTNHPVFGQLNFEEWVQLHHKHVTHHLKQFGLL